MLSGVDPAVAVALERLVLTSQIDALVLGAAALGKGAGAGAEFGGDGGVLCDPVGEGVFAVLDDAKGKKCVRDLVVCFWVRRIVLRFASFVAIVGSSRLAWSDGRVVDEVKQVLAEAGDDG